MSASRRLAPCMLAPALLLFTVFILIPAALTIIGSFFSFGLTSPNWEFAGLGNYAQAAHDPVFWLSLRNNLIIVFGSIVAAGRHRHDARRHPRSRHPPRLDLLPHDHLHADGHLVGRRRR